MGKIKDVEVYRRSWTLDVAQQTVVDIPSDNMPSGSLWGFTVRLECAALTGLGAAASDYTKVLRAATWGAQQPKFNVGTAIPGKDLDKFISTFLRKNTSRVAPTTGGFSTNWYLPFSWQGTDRKPAFRKSDTALLNIGNKAQPFLNLLLGAYGDLGTTISVAPSVVVIVEAHYDPNPRPGMHNPENGTLSGDQPGRYLEISFKQKADLSSNPVAQLLTGGGRECIGVGVIEKDNTGAEVSDIFNMGQSTPSKFEIVKGDSDVYNPRQKLLALDADMADEFGVALPTGYHFWMAAREGKLADCVPLEDAQPFILQADNLVTTASRVWQIVQINTINLSLEARTMHAAWLGVPAPAK